MIGPLKKRGIAGLCALALLAACGSDAENGTIKSIGTTFLASLKAGKAPEPQPLTAQQIGQALASTSEPVNMIVVENRQAQGLVQQIEVNGPYRTYANPQRHAIIFRSGIVTATRGLGGDLMSSDINRLLPLIRSRQSGVAPYTMRFLDGEDVTYELTYSCNVTSGGTHQVAAGVINTSARLMSAKCTGNGPELSNSFLVAGNGSVVGSRQWLGDLTGYVSVQPLRP
jgi:hypothetical protein